MVATRDQKNYRNERQCELRASKVLTEEQIKKRRELGKARQRKRREKLTKKQKQLEYAKQDLYKKEVWLQNPENVQKQKEYKRTSDIKRHNYNSFEATLCCIEY